MPRLWSDTIETHRRAVREATLDATADLVAEHGLRSVTMSRIADLTGIGRATLYKYFPDVDAILLAWHERQITAHLELLSSVRDRINDPVARLGGVLETYALLAHGSHGHADVELKALLHRDDHLHRVQHQVFEMISDLLVEAVKAGGIRNDVSPAELARYCVHALGAASNLSSKAAVRRLVQLTVAGMRPPPDQPGQPRNASGPTP